MRRPTHHDIPLFLFIFVAILGLFTPLGRLPLWPWGLLLIAIPFVAFLLIEWWIPAIQKARQHAHRRLV